MGRFTKATRPEGSCYCGRVSVAGKVLCDGCRAKWDQRGQRLQAQGLCKRCGKRPPKRGRLNCQACIDRGVAWNRQKLTGVTPEQYARMAEVQDGRCGVCGVVGTLAADHDHTTGQARGLLCVSCNTGLGLIGDTVERARALIAYLERTSQDARTSGC